MERKCVKSRSIEDKIKDAEYIAEKTGHCVYCGKDDDMRYCMLANGLSNYKCKYSGKSIVYDKNHTMRHNCELK